MNLIQGKTRYPIAILLSLACAGSYPVAAQEQVVEDTSENRVIPDLVGRVVMDPHRDFANVHGPDDCPTESVFQSTRTALGSYAADPEANSEALKAYIMSGEAQCNCASTIVGQDFNILLDDIGTDLSSVPCL